MYVGSSFSCVLTLSPDPCYTLASFCFVPWLFSCFCSVRLIIFSFNPILSWICYNLSFISKIIFFLCSISFMRPVTSYFASSWYEEFCPFLVYFCFELLNVWGFWKRSVNTLIIYSSVWDIIVVFSTLWFLFLSFFFFGEGCSSAEEFLFWFSVFFYNNFLQLLPIVL